MGEVKRTVRGIDARKQQVYIDAYEKEARLRMKWFRKNEDRLVAFAEKPNARAVPHEILEEITSNRQANYQGVERKAVPKMEDAPPPLIDPDAIYNIMKPVDPATKKLIYSGMQKDGRINYLRERVKIIPENKFYFPETSSFIYGWNMWHSSKTATSVRYGRSQVIKESFYRRNGVARDPDWYQEPEIISPMVCGCI